MLKAKFIVWALYATGVAEMAAASEVNNMWAAIVSVLCGLVTVCMGVLATSYLKHIGDVSAHTPPTGLVSEQTCSARVGGLRREVGMIHSLLKTHIKSVGGKIEYNEDEEG